MSSLSAVDVKLSCFVTQHSRWPNSPTALVGDTHGKNTETATLLDFDQWKIQGHSSHLIVEHYIFGWSNFSFDSNSKFWSG